MPVVLTLSVINATGVIWDQDGMCVLLRVVRPEVQKYLGPSLSVTSPPTPEAPRGSTQGRMKVEKESRPVYKELSP